MSSPHADPPPGTSDTERRLRDARLGGDDALGQLLQGCRQYLLLVANEQFDRDLRDKLAPSDLVQDTFLEAQRDFARFHGTTQEELLAWLRRILLNNLADARIRFRAGKRDLRREVALDDPPHQELRNGLTHDADSPGARLVALEQAEALREALSRLPEASRQIIQWRNYDLCSFAEIGRRLGKSEEAARKAWVRAVEHLQKLLEPPA